MKLLIILNLIAELIFPCQNGKNGTKIDILYVNNHVFDNFYLKKMNYGQIKKSYRYNKNKQEWANKLIDIIKEKKFSKIIIQYESGHNKKTKKLLKKLNIHTNISRTARCGYQCILENIDKYKCFLIGFSIYKDNSLSYGDETKISGQHLDNEEYEIIKQLHNKNLLDASLCLLEDNTEKYVLNCEYFNPTEHIINLLLKYYKKVILKNCNFNLNLYDLDYYSKSFDNNNIILLK